MTRYFRLISAYLFVSAISFWGGIEYQKAATLLISDSDKSSHFTAHHSPTEQSHYFPLVKKALEVAPAAVAIESTQLSTSLLSSTQVQESSISVLEDIIESSSEEEVEDILKMFFDDTELLDEINDVKLFSRRLLEELSDKESAVDELSNAQIYFSLTSDYPDSPQQHFEVDNRQKIFAHINTSGGLGGGDGKFFTRWINKTSGEVLLFKQKPIKRDSSKNWVSFTPDESWLNGAYEVSFYQFNSGLNKLSSNIFYVAVE